jgi:carboxypeptidase family protein
MSKISRFTLLWAIVLPLLFGQNDSGRIAGTVADPTGAVVPNAAIKVVDEKTGQERKVVADSAGYFVIANLAPSTYKVTAQGNGLGPAETAGIPLSVGQERVLNIVVQPASVATSVEVSGGELTVVDTSSAAISANVNAREVGQLPLNGRQQLR